MVTKKQMALDYLAIHESATLMEIAEHIGSNRNSTTVMLVGLKKEDLVKSVGRGIYGRVNGETEKQNPATPTEDLPGYKKDIMGAKGPRKYVGVVETRLDRAIKPEPLPESFRPSERTSETIILTYMKEKEIGYRATRRELLKLGITNRDVKDAVKQGYLSQYKSDGSYHLTEKGGAPTSKRFRYKPAEDHGLYLGSGRRLRF